MIYLLDRLDIEILEFNKKDDHHVCYIWETEEQRVKRWIENERCQSIFSRFQIINLFQTGKIQVVKVDKIKIKSFDKIIIFTKAGKFFVMEFVKMNKMI